MFDRFTSFLGSVLAGNVNLRKEDGQTFVEYALILAVVVVAVLLAVTWTGLGEAIDAAITKVSEAITPP
jgi:Flp pilus assembly pilin Flp